MGSKAHVPPDKLGAHTLTHTQPNPHSTTLSPINTHTTTHTKTHLNKQFSKGREKKTEGKEALGNRRRDNFGGLLPFSSQTAERPGRPPLVFCSLPGVRHSSTASRVCSDEHCFCSYAREGQMTEGRRPLHLEEERMSSSTTIPFPAFDLSKDLLFWSTF